MTGMLNLRNVLELYIFQLTCPLPSLSRTDVTTGLKKRRSRSRSSQFTKIWGLKPRPSRTALYFSAIVLSSTQKIK